MYKGKVIYNPSGKAKEYSYWAANFYNGCSHGCTYCYLKKGRGKAIFGGDEPTLKKQLIDSEKAFDIFKVEAIKNISELKEHGLFFSFTTDPLLKETIELTILATEFCNHNDIPVKVLSKSHEGILNYIDAIENISLNKNLIAIGVTLTGCDELEPKASKNYDRIIAICMAKMRGFKTFASIEPIPIDSFHRAFRVIKQSYPHIDLFKIGLESGKQYKERDVNFFLDSVFELSCEYGFISKIYLKESIKKFTSKENFPYYCVDRDYNLFTKK